MDRMTAKERDDTIVIILAETTRADVSEIAAREFLDYVEPQVMRLHRLYEHACNRPLNLRETAEIPQIEYALRDRFRVYGLKFHLNTDPRGNPVGILTPKSHRSNNMGGEDWWL